MKVQLKLFATYREYLPSEAEGNKIEVEVDSNTNVRTLLKLYGVPIDRTSVILINGRTPDGKKPLEDGDVVSAFPAIAGGLKPYNG